MKSLLRFALLLIFLTACASGGRPSGPVSWPTGQYRLEGTVEYTNDTSFSSQTTQETYSAELTVTLDGQMSLTSFSGLCIEPSSMRLREDQELGRRSFECGNATYTVWPVARTIAGEMSAVVVENRRVRTACIRYVTSASGAQTCAEYSWEAQPQRTTKHVRLRVLEGL